MQQENEKIMGIKSTNIFLIHTVKGRDKNLILALKLMKLGFKMADFLSFFKKI